MDKDFFAANDKQKPRGCRDDEERCDASRLWGDYLFLTTQMLTVLRRNDGEMFNEMLEQRQQLQIRIDACVRQQAASQESVQSEQEAQWMEIVRLNRDIKEELLRQMQEVKRQMDTVGAYDRMETNHLENRFDQRR
ncbi:hypothetical protein HM1_1212 [Heliomicrobium modesticaldum Ice1]|uniref:Flagellar protein FliT n=1 Tax=Heliobacterium modesticaldum (strain ATCC 51547 / Ice1) TaxID=498761 RepID=B0TH37_HELMI|nr:hypothetical protein [Heliomicrobium modesticaldum]ABZ83362.1 hypothetical protein HM1_1212 [Heliomicrobium modesticaldum Ice1]